MLCPVAVDPEKGIKTEMTLNHNSTLAPLARFITHQIPRGLAVDEVIELGATTARQMEVVEEEK